MTDAVYLVKSGKCSRRELTPDQQSFIEGMEAAVAALETMIELTDFGELDETHKLRSEIAREMLEEVKTRMQICVCEKIVEFIYANKNDYDGRRNDAEH